MQEIVFEVEGEVVGKGRPRFARTGHAYTPERTRLYERDIRVAYMAAGGGMFDGAVHVDIEAVTGLQKTATKAAQKRRLAGDEIALKKPDLDNVEKIVLDALNGLAYADDVRVASVRKIKGRYEEKPRLIVRVREMDPHEITETHQWLWDGE